MKNDKKFIKYMVLARKVVEVLVMPIVFRSHGINPKNLEKWLDEQKIGGRIVIT